MKIREWSQRKDILNLKERNIVGTMKRLITWRKIVGLKKKKGDKNEDDTKEDNVESNTLQDGLILCLDNINDSWVLDYGASFHAAPQRKYFQDYVQDDFGQVYLGDDEPYPIVGKGSIRIKFPNGNEWIL